MPFLVQVRAHLGLGSVMKDWFQESNKLMLYEVFNL